MTHIALPDEQLPGGQIVVGDNLHPRAAAGPPVFLHCGWRTRGTWIWNRFRQLPGVTGFYEPLGQTLASLRAASLASITAASWPSGHRGLTRPYFDEYRPLLRRNGPGVRGYQPGFATAGFFAAPDAALPELHDYLRALLRLARDTDTQPVLKFCGSIGRIGWMRRHFPDAVHIVVLRDPFTQFASAARQFARDGNARFLAMPLLLLGLHRDLPLVARCLRHLAVEPPDLTRGGATDAALEACEAHLRVGMPAAWYRGFLAFWVATAASIPDGVDMIIDSGALARSDPYRSHCESELAHLTRRMVDFADADEAGDAGPAVTLPLRRSELLRAHAAAETCLAEQIGADWADTGTMGVVAGLLAEARSRALAAGGASGASHREAPDPFRGGPDFAATLLSALARAAWAERELAAMRGSRSWRVTAPLRWLRRSLG